MASESAHHRHAAVLDLCVPEEGERLVAAQRREADRVKHLVARLGPHALPI